MATSHNAPTELHEAVLSGLGKEREMGVQQTPSLYVQIYMQGGLSQRQVHSCSNVRL